MRSLALLLALSACTTAGVVIPDDGSVGDVDSDTEPDTEPDPVSAYAGAWEATLVLVADFGRGPTDLCIADLELVVDDEGGLTTDGFCEVTFGGGGGGQGQSGYEVVVEGAIDDEGAVDATSVWVAVGRGIAPIDDVPLSGETTETTGEATGTTVINIGFQLDAEVGLSLSR